MMTEMIGYLLGRNMFGAKHFFIYGGLENGGGFYGLKQYPNLFECNTTVSDGMVTLWK